MYHEIGLYNLHQSISLELYSYELKFIFKVKVPCLQPFFHIHTQYQKAVVL